MSIFDSFAKKREQKYGVIKPSLCFFNINEEYQKRTEALRANKPATYAELTSPKTEEPKVEPKAEPVNEAVKPEAEKKVQVNYEVINNDVVDKEDIVTEKVIDVPNENVVVPTDEMIQQDLLSILNKKSQGVNPEDMKDPVKAKLFVKELINDFMDLSFDKYLDQLIDQKNFDEFKKVLMGSLTDMTTGTGGTIPEELTKKLIDDANNAFKSSEDLKDKAKVRAKIKSLVNQYTDAMLDQVKDFEDTAETPLKEEVVGTKKEAAESRTNYIGEILLKYIDLYKMDVNLDQTQYTDYPFANRTYNLRIQDMSGTRYYSIDDGTYIPNRVSLIGFHPTYGAIGIPLSKKTKKLVTSLLQTLRPLNDEEFAFVKERYYMPDLSIYPNIDFVGAGKVNVMTPEEKLQLDSNIKQVVVATAVDNGFIRYRFEKLVDANNFVLVSDALVSNPDPINIPMVIANLRVKFENGAMSTEMLQ